jgi:hypothetical protein
MRNAVFISGLILLGLVAGACTVGQNPSSTSVLTQEARDSSLSSGTEVNGGSTGTGSINEQTVLTGLLLMEIRDPDGKTKDTQIVVYYLQGDDGQNTTLRFNKISFPDKLFAKHVRVIGSLVDSETEKQSQILQVELVHEISP